MISATAQITAQGVTSRFFIRDGEFLVHTDGPDGELKDYPISYTFGWSPLQQYLIAFPGGRLQSLGLAWDTRPREQGGQDWFHLYPDQALDHRHPLHWTAPDQTWNYQCADCHSTDLQKRYDAKSKGYDTRYAEINVACEACHGAGARHLAWAKAAAARSAQAGGTGTDEAAHAAVADDPTRGLLVDLKDRDGGLWRLSGETGKPSRQPPRHSQIQTETCARCHSRRGRIWDGMKPGEKKSIKLSAEEAFGPRDEKALQHVPRSSFPQPDSLQVGQILGGMDQGRRVSATIKEIKPDEVVLDLNHPLAGKAVTFEVEVVSTE